MQQYRDEAIASGEGAEAGGYLKVRRLTPHTTRRIKSVIRGGERREGVEAGGCLKVRTAPCRPGAWASCCPFSLH